MGGFGEVCGTLAALHRARVFGPARRVRIGRDLELAGGLVLTNAHVATHRESQVELWDGRRLPARVTARDTRRDLATLQIAAPGLEAATPGDSGALRAGELVIAVGNPMGFAGAVSTGVVHSIGRLPGMGRQSWILANVRLAPGNSGGPLADAQGRVVGINTADRQRSGRGRAIERCGRLAASRTPALAGRGVAAGVAGPDDSGSDRGKCGRGGVAARGRRAADSHGRPECRSRFGPRRATLAVPARRP